MEADSVERHDGDEPAPSESRGGGTGKHGTVTVTRTAASRRIRPSNLADTREQYGRRSSRTAEAFQALVRDAAEAGAPIDGLRHHTENETERFFSWTIPGVDEHVYWDGPSKFFQNNGMGRTPRRWWWHHRYGNLPDNKDDLVVKCGEKNCINPDHAAKERNRGTRMQWTEERIIGALQVAAMRLGHTPNAQEWEREGFRPSNATVWDRFGNWDKAVAAAGLPEAWFSSKERTKTDVLRGIQLVRKVLGKWPSEEDYKLCKPELKAAGLPVTVGAAKRLYGQFTDARQAAGGPGKQRQGRARTDGPSPSRRGSLRNKGSES